MYRQNSVRYKLVNPKDQPFEFWTIWNLNFKKFVIQMFPVFKWLVFRSPLYWASLAFISLLEINSQSKRVLKLLVPSVSVLFVVGLQFCWSIFVASKFLERIKCSLTVQRSLLSGKYCLLTASFFLFQACWIIRSPFWTKYNWFLLNYLT